MECMVGKQETFPSQSMKCKVKQCQSLVASAGIVRLWKSAYGIVEVGCVQFTLKIKVWLKLKRCDGKVESLCVQKSFDVMEKLKV